MLAQGLREGYNKLMLFCSLHTCTCLEFHEKRQRKKGSQAKHICCQSPRESVAVRGRDNEAGVSQPQDQVRDVARQEKGPHDLGQLCKIRHFLYVVLWVWIASKS